MAVNSNEVGAKTRHLPQLALTVLSKATVPKAVQPLVDTQELHPPISLNMVVCLNNQDLNQPDRWLTSSLQASSLVSKADMVDRPPNLLVNTLTSRWVTEVLLALVVMAVVLSKHPMLNGVPPLPKALETDLVDTRDKQNIHLTTDRNFHCNVSACRVGVVFGNHGISNQESNFLHSFLSIWHGFAYGSPFSRQSFRLVLWFSCVG